MRLNDTSAWVISQVGYQTFTTIVAEKYEDNLRFIKLTFPVKNDSRWKGNTYINYTDNTFCDWLGSDWEYKLSDVDASLMINGIPFERTARIIAIDDTNPICKNYFEEAYARNVGMIYRNAEKINYNLSGPSGFEIEYKIKSYN